MARTMPLFAAAMLLTAACDPAATSGTFTAGSTTNALTPGFDTVLVRDTVIYSARGGSPAEWTWSTGDSTIAAVRPNGMVIGRTVGRTVITARSVADPNLMLYGNVWVWGRGTHTPGSEIITISSAAGDIPTDPDALRGPINVHLVLYTAPYPVARTAELLVLRTSGDTVLGSTVAPPLTAEWDGVIRWNTDARVNGSPAFPNGRYRIAARMSANGAPIVTGNAVSVIVNNP